MKQPDGERLAVLEEQAKELRTGMDGIKTRVDSLHTKFDSLAVTLSEKYVSKEAFDGYKRAKSLERLLTIIVTAIITGLVMFFFEKAQGR